MGCALAVDTNVFLLTNDVNCQKVLQRVRLLWEDMLLLDREHRLEKEYKRLAQQHPESPLRGLVKLLLDQSGAAATPGDSAVAVHLDSQLTPEEYGLMDCCDTAEPMLFGITRGQPQTYLVIPGDRHIGREPIERCYRKDGKLEELLARFPDIQLVTTENLAVLSEPGDPAPRTLQQLEAFLNEHRLDARTPERTFIECKCSGDVKAGITDSLAEDIMKAICGFANHHPGYVFVGVQDNGAICGVPRQFDRARRSSWDLVLRDLMERLNRFRPEPPVVTPWWIPVTDEENVLAIRVERYRLNNFTYKGHRYERVGTSSPRRDRLNS